jgi:hypothetical protein
MRSPRVLELALMLFALAGVRAVGVIRSDRLLAASRTNRVAASS